jgi:hypothetical protein
VNPDNERLARTTNRLVTEILHIGVTQDRPERALDVLERVLSDEESAGPFIACFSFHAAAHIGLQLDVRTGLMEGPELHAWRLISAASHRDNALLNDFAVVAARMPWEWQRELLLVLFRCVADAQWIRGALS